MKNQQSVGLVVEGNATSSSVLRLSNVIEDLGPIKAGAMRVARRLANFLRAGYAVDSYEELRTARLVLIRVPDASLPRTVEELCGSELVFRDLAFVLCESCLSSSALKPLQDRGATVATVTPVQSIRQSWFILEGQLAAMRHVRRFLERNNSRAFELRPGTKPLYFAAQMMALGLPSTCYAAAQQALRAAGISGNRLHGLLEEMSFEMFRAFSNGIRFRWPGARLGCTREVADEYLGLLRQQHPQLAALLDNHLISAESGMNEQVDLS